MIWEILKLSTNLARAKSVDNCLERASGRN